MIRMQDLNNFITKNNCGNLLKEININYQKSYIIKNKKKKLPRSKYQKLKKYQKYYLINSNKIIYAGMTAYCGSMRFCFLF